MQFLMILTAVGLLAVAFSLLRAASSGMWMCCVGCNRTYDAANRWESTVCDHRKCDCGGDLEWDRSLNILYRFTGIVFAFGAGCCFYLAIGGV